MADYIINITDNKLYKSVVESSPCVVVRYYADWCSFCKKSREKYEKISRAYHNKWIFAAVDVDKLSTEIPISQVPTYVLYHKGKPVLVTNDLDKIKEAM